MRMALPFSPPVEPMLAALQEDIPEGEGWLYEPKWDGFRALVFRDGAQLFIQSRKGQPLGRYFPELVEALRGPLPDRCVLDGEIIIPGEGALDFDALLQRIHPAQSRVALLAKQTPASFVAFDLLAGGAKDLRPEPFSGRRRLLEDAVAFDGRVLLTPQTDDPRVARRWFERFEGAGLDGIIAKSPDLPYVHGERVMVKVKHERTADCVVGGYRRHKAGGVGSLLLGLYDDDGVLHHVGHTSAFSARVRRELEAELAPLLGGPSFGEGRTPGGPSRWAQGRDMSWISVRPERVCEVKFDHLQGTRFRHAARFLRWRPDKAPEQCDFLQLRPPYPFRLDELPQVASAAPSS
jgi:ATP-dependent DNA ligase